MHHRIAANESPYTIHESHHADAKYYFLGGELSKHQGCVAPAADIIITPGLTASFEPDAFGTPHYGKRNQRKEQARRHGKSIMVTPSSNTQNALLAPSSGALATPILLRSVPGPQLTLRAEVKDSSMIKSLKSDDLTHLNSAGAQGVPKLLTSKNDMPPPLMLCTDITERGTTIPPKGMVRKRVAKIEDQQKVGLKQPPSMYTSVTTPLDVWLVPGQAGCKPPMLFYKAPHALPCDFVIKLPKACLETEETATTTKAEQRMVRLL
jgi:hypothetical protein